MNLLNDEPPLPEPWSEDDQRPICYLFAFTAQECRWNGKNVHDHPHFGKFFNTIVDMYPMYPDLSDYDEVFDPDHFAPPRKIRCDNWANPPCSYTPNECSPKVTDVESLKGFCGFQDATTGMYGDNFDRCWDCPDKPEDCDWAIGNCLQECFGYEGSGCYGSECENSVQNLEESGSDLALDNSTEDPYAGTVPYPSSDPGSDPGSDPDWDNTQSDPATNPGSETGSGSDSISPSGSESGWEMQASLAWNGPKKCQSVTMGNRLRCGRLPRTPRSATPEQCTQECADEQHCKYAIWHSGKYVNENKPDLPEPWSRRDTRPVCYLFSFASTDGCEWDGYKEYGCSVRREASYVHWVGV